MPFVTVDFFSHSDTLYALNAGHELYRSLDSGDTWQAITGFSTVQAQFFYVGDRLCAYAMYQLWDINIAEQVIKELDNDGLEGNRIMSVHEIADRVYVNTQNGLFYRDVDDFFTYKPDDTDRFIMKFYKKKEIINNEIF